MYYSHKLKLSRSRVEELTTEMGLERGPWWSFVKRKFMMNEGSEGNNLGKTQEEKVIINYFKAIQLQLSYNLMCMT